MDLVQRKSKIYRSSFFTIYKYILSEFIFSFTVAFLFFFFIFFVNQILLMAEEILLKNVSLKNVSLVILYSLPSIFVFSLPFASLVGGLMSIGRMSSDNEILSFRASGISYKKLFLPVIIIGVFLSLLSFIVNDYFLPISTIKFSRLYREILFSSPELELESYSIKHYQDSIIITGKVDNQTISNLIIIDKTKEKNDRIILAEKAKLSSELDKLGITSLELSNVLGITPIKKQRGDLNYFTSTKMIYNILLSNISLSIRNLTPREMSSIDVYRSMITKWDKQRLLIFQNDRRIEDLKGELYSNYYLPNTNYANLNSIYTEIMKKSQKTFFDKNLQIYRIELHKKFAVPIASLFFLFFSFPIAINSRKSGQSMGFGIGLFVSIFYWSLLFAGQTLGIRINFPPFFSIWSPNIVILSLGIIFMIIRFKK